MVRIDGVLMTSYQLLTLIEALENQVDIDGSHHSVGEETNAELLRRMFVDIGRVQGVLAP